MPSQTTILHNILYRIGPAWHLWEYGEDALVEELRAFVALEYPDRCGVDSDAEAARCAIWLLDRLLPTDEREFFADLWTREDTPARHYAYYAWARRLPQENRHDLLDVPEKLRQSFLGSAEAAWCETCPQEDLESLLTWVDLRVKRGWPREHHFGGLALQQYCLRTNRETRLERLLEFVVDAYERSQQSDGVGLPHMAALSQLVATAAEAYPPLEEYPTESDDYTETLGWLDTELRDGGHSAVADICRAVAVPNRGFGHMLYAAWNFWIRRHDASTWECLEQAYAAGSGEGFCGYRALAHLARIVPPGRLSAWHGILESESQHGIYPIMAFCRWLQDSERDALLPHFQDDDLDWAACAFQAYLHRAPNEVSRYLWESSRARQQMPGWQEMILDRFLYAPEPTRPGSLFHDDQDVDADIRLEDPLNHRGR